MARFSSSGARDLALGWSALEAPSVGDHGKSGLVGALTHFYTSFVPPYIGNHHLFFVFPSIGNHHLNWPIFFFSSEGWPNHQPAGEDFKSMMVPDLVNIYPIWGSGP